MDRKQPKFGREQEDLEALNDGWDLNDEQTEDRNAADHQTVKQPVDRGSNDDQTVDQGSNDDQTVDRGSNDDQTVDRGSSDDQAVDRGLSDDQAVDRGSSDDQPDDRGSSDDQAVDRGLGEDQTKDPDSKHDQPDDRDSKHEQTESDDEISEADILKIESLRPTAQNSESKAAEDKPATSAPKKMRKATTDEIHALFDIDLAPKKPVNQVDPTPPRPASRPAIPPPAPPNVPKVAAGRPKPGKLFPPPAPPNVPKVAAGRPKPGKPFPKPPPLQPAFDDTIQSCDLITIRPPKKPGFKYTPKLDEDDFADDGLDSCARPSESLIPLSDKDIEYFSDQEPGSLTKFIPITISEPCCAPSERPEKMPSIPVTLDVALQSEDLKNPRYPSARAEEVTAEKIQELLIDTGEREPENQYYFEPPKGPLQTLMQRIGESWQGFWKKISGK